MATAREHSQWVTLMRQWMMRLDGNSTADHAGKSAAELEALAACEDVAERELA